MKILTGTLKGREIIFKPNPHLRPTGDKVRKAIFDTLQNFIQEAVVLDLFSGTGALGLEALSAGASQAVFVEKDKRQAQRIRENLLSLGLLEKGFVLNRDAITALEDLNRKGRVFDIVLVDAPYQKGWEAKLAGALDSFPVISRRSWVVMECSGKSLLPENMGPLVRKKEKVYGDTRVVIYGG